MGGVVDFALCEPATEPAILIEVKQPGNADTDAAVEQILRYAYSSRVPFVVLTDGSTWRFYLPAERELREDGSFYKLDLHERSVSDASERLQRYLLHSRVKSGEALKSAREDHEAGFGKKRAKQAIPGAWVELVENQNESLVEILTNAVESKSGVRPEEDDVAEFLKSMNPAAIIPPVKPGTPKGRGETPGLSPNELILYGKSYSCRNAMEVTSTVLTELSARDPSFLERFSRHPRAAKRQGRYVARRIEDIHPHRDDAVRYVREIPGGWYVDTNLSNAQKMRIIKLVAEVSGLTFGKDIDVGF